MARRYSRGESETPCTPRMPHLRAESPRTLVSMTMAVKTRVFRSGGTFLRTTQDRRALLFVFDKLLTLGAQRQIFAGLFVKTPAIVTMEHRLADQPPGNLRTEIILAVEA